MGLKPGRKPLSERAMTGAERQARFKAAHAAGEPRIRYRRPADRRSRPEKWREACVLLLDVLDDYQAWRDAMPEHLAGTAVAERLDAVLELRDLIEQLEAAELPKGFGRD